MYGRITTVTDQRRLLTSGQLAAELGVSVDTIRRWRKGGRIRPTEVTAYGHPRWDLGAVRQQLAEDRPTSRDDWPV